MLSQTLHCCKRLSRGALLLACLAIQPGSALESTSQTAGDLSRIERVALSLGDEPEARAEFAHVALSEMVFSLLAETELAKQQMHTTQRQASLSCGTSCYVCHMWRQDAWSS
jgi:hypothetical protein